MVEDKKALTLWDFYESNKQYFGGLIIDDRPGAEDLIILLDKDEAGRREYIKQLPEDFVAGFDLSLLPPAGTAA